MTLEYMKWSLAKYRDIRERAHDLCERLKQENKLNIFYLWDIRRR